jgi:hypothetical protein
MNTDQFIQFGLLVVAALGLLGSTAYFVANWIRNRRGLRIELKQFGSDCGYIYAVTAGSGKLFVESLAVWARIRICNDTPNRFLVADICAYEEHLKPRSIIGCPVRQIEHSQESVIMHDPVSVPFTVDAGDGINLWFLVEVKVPESVGTILFQRYGQQSLKHQTVRQLLPMLERGEKEVGQKLRSDPRLPKGIGVQVTDFKFLAVTAHVPFPSRPEDKTVFAPVFGKIPSDAFLTILAEERDEGSKKSPLKVEHQKFFLDIVTGAGKRIRHVLETGSDALWFLYRHRNRSPD